MTKRLFDHAQHATLDEQLALEARAADGGDEDGGLHRGRDRVPREAPAELQRSVESITTVDYHTGGEPFRIVTGGVQPLAGRDDPREAALRAGAARPRPSPARLRAARPRRHVRLLRDRAGGRATAISASSSSTTPATRPPAGTGRSRSSPGRSSTGLVEGPRGGRRRAVGAAAHGRASSRTAVSRRCASATCRRSSRRAGSRRPAATVDVAFGGAFYACASRSRSSPRELPRLIELGREIKARPGGDARDRPPRRARAARRLRRDLLAGGGSGRSRSGT